MLAGIFILYPLNVYCDDPTHQINQKQLEISRTEQQISNLNSSIERLEASKLQLQSRSDEQQALILDLGRLMIEQQVQAVQTQQAEDQATQELHIHQSIVLAQLQNELVKQQAIVRRVDNQLQQQLNINIPSDALQRAHSESEIQRNRLANLQAQFQTAQVQIEMERSRRHEQGTQAIVNQRAAVQALEQQEKEAKATYEQIQRDLKSVQDQVNLAQTDLQNLETRKQNLAIELTDLNKKVS